MSEIPDPEAADIIRQLTDATLKRTGVSVVIPGSTGPAMPTLDETLPSLGKEQ